MSSNSSQFPLTPANRQFQFKPWLVEAGIIFIFALATILINWKMIRDGLNGMTDLPTHTLWIQHFSKELAEGIWYPRWLAGTNYGYGSPTFVFYPPLTYYMGSVLKLSGLNIEHTIIALFSLALFVSGIAFYIYGRNRWGKIAALVGGLAYMTAPYFAFDIYFRGGVASMWAQALIPLGFWLTDRAICQPKWRVALALFFAIFALTHVPSLLISTIFWLPYTLYFLLKRPWKAIVATIGFAAIGLGIASFYLLPAILERSLVNIEIMRGVYGGFKPNLFGNPLPIRPYMIKQIQRMQYIFSSQGISIMLLGIIALFSQYKYTNKKIETLCWIVFSLATVFLMSYISFPIWEASKILQMIQFPWRILAMFSFAGAALCGLAVNGIIKSKPPIKIFMGLIIAGILWGNFQYVYKLSRSLPTIHNPGRGKTDSIERFNQIIQDAYTDKLKDVEEYIPLLKTGVVANAPIVGQPRFSLVRGKAEIQLEKWGSYNRIFKVIAKEVSTMGVRTYYYPAWHLYVNNTEYPIDVADGDGTIEIKLKPGNYTVELRYQWTKNFTLGTIVSIVSISALMWFGIKQEKKARLDRSIS